MSVIKLIFNEIFCAFRLVIYWIGIKGFIVRVSPVKSDSVIQGVRNLVFQGKSGIQISGLSPILRVCWKPGNKEIKSVKVGFPIDLSNRVI